MESLMRPMARRELTFFLLCLVASLLAHVLVAWFAAPGSSQREEPKDAGLAERYVRVVNTVTGLDARGRARLEEALARFDPKHWTRGEMAETLQWMATDLGIAVRDSRVVRALDPERSQEGRWDLQVWIDWEEDRTAADLLSLIYLVGEGTLKSDFGSHRFWIHLSARDGSGRVAFETMDCRLYRAGRLPASDLLHRAAWVEP